MSVSHAVLSAVFSDETPTYRFPSEPNPNDTVTIRLRVARGSARRVILVFEPLTMGALMTLSRSDDFFDYYEAGVVCDDEEVIYRFLIECTDGAHIAFDKSGARVEDLGVIPSPALYFALAHSDADGGATVTHTMTGFTGRNVRTTRISCTGGEIVGDGERLHICRFGSADADLDPSREPFALRETNPSRHGGGDFNLVRSAIRLVRSGDAAAMKTCTEAALESHLMAFAAEESRLNGGRVVELK